MMLPVYHCTVKLEYYDPWDPQTVVVIQKVVVGQIFIHISWVGDSGWLLLTGGCCSEVVVNTGLTVLKITLISNESDNVSDVKDFYHYDYVILLLCITQLGITVVSSFFVKL